jgi:ligand-binding sensor domain-containing protein/two-component sensor histidine kinase
LSRFSNTNTKKLHPKPLKVRPWLGKNLALLVMFSWSLEAFGQDLNEYIFNHRSINDGLASNFVNCVFRDKKGFLWIGSENGLQRYDGNKFISPYRGFHAGALPPFPVHQVMEDKDGRMWLRMDNRIGIFDPVMFQFQSIPVQSKTNLPPNGEYRLYKDRKGQVFLVISRFGWFYFDAATSSFRADKAPFPIPADWGVRKVVEDKQTGNYWIAGDRGLGLYDAKKRQLYSYSNNPLQHPLLSDARLSKYVTNVYIDRNRKFWLVNWDQGKNSSGGQSFFCYDERTQRYTNDTLGLANAGNSGYFEAETITEFADTVMLFYGNHCMVMKDRDRFEGFEDTYNTGFGITFNKVNQVMEDKENLLWVATDNGLYSMPLKRGTSRHMVLKQSGGVLSTFNALKQTADGRLWIGSWGRGVLVREHSLERASINVYKNAPTDGNYKLVWDIEEHRSGAIWIGCQAGRLMIYDPKQAQTKFLVPAVFQNKTIRQIRQDPAGNLWFGTQNGQLVKWTNGNAFSDGAFTEVKQLGAMITELLFDKQGMLWVATNGKGVFRMNPQSGAILKQYKMDAGSLSYNENVADILQLNDSLFAFAGDALNIVAIQSGRIVQTVTYNGELLQGVLAMQVDGDGALWVSTGTGIYKCNLQKNQVNKYSQWDGLITVSNNSFVMDRSLTLQNGNIVFAGNQNLVSFKPSTYKNKSAPPDVMITDFRLFDRFLPVDSLSALNTVELSNKENSISFDFSALSFSPQSKLTYYFKLDGADEDWIRAEGPPHATYTLLPPGHYTFMVKAENEEGLASKKITQLRIYIAPPFWRTPWFIGLVALVLCGLAYYWHRMRIERLLQIERVRTRLARDLHDDMGSTLSSINILSNMAIKKIESDQQVTKDYMVKISDNSSRMMEAMDDIVWSINPINDTMRKMLARMKEFAGDVLEARDIEYSFQTDEAVKEMTFTMDQRREIFLIFKEAINNIVKYAQSSEVKVVMRLKNRQFVMQVIDNGIGFDYISAGPGSAKRGNGMRNMQKRAEMVNGTFLVESAKQNGTLIELRVPVA